MLSLPSKKGVVYLTDDALFVYTASGKSVILKEMYEWGVETLQGDLTKLLQKNYSSVVVLNDTVDQHYRKERIPKVGVLDAANVVKRRLSMAFPEYPIRTYREIPQPKNIKDQDAAAMKHYLFCACPDNGNIRTVINAIRDSGVGFTGLCLLPMESEGLIQKLSEAMEKKKTGFLGKSKAKTKGKKDDKSAAKTGWTLFVGQNASGGLRQVVIRNGMLALTRISPIVETDADLSLWCREVERELESTLGYLSRFGYNEGDPLNIIVIANPNASQIFEELGRLEVDVDVIDSKEAMKLVGLKPTKSELLHVSNSLHVGWVAKKVKLAAPMASGVIDSIIKPRLAATAAAAALALGLIGSMYYFSTSIIAYNSNLRNYEVVSAQKNQIDTVYDKEIERKEALGINLKLMQSSYDISEELAQSQIDPLSVFQSIAKSMEGQLKLDSVTVEKGEPALDAYGYPMPVSNEEGSAAPSRTVLKFSFPGSVDIEKGNAAVLDFKSRLEGEFPQAEVKVAKILKEVSYRGELETQIGMSRAELAPDQLGAEIIITQGGAK